MPKPPQIFSRANGLIYQFPDAQSCIPPHTHEVMSHYTYVLYGQFVIACDDGELSAGPGNFIDFPCGEQHYIQPLGAGAVFNRFHPPCANFGALERLIHNDLRNLRATA